MPCGSGQPVRGVAVTSCLSVPCRVLSRCCHGDVTAFQRLVVTYVMICVTCGRDLGAGCERGTSNDRGTSTISILVQRRESQPQVMNVAAYSTVTPFDLRT